MDKMSSLIGGIILFLIAFEGASIILTGKARAFRWMGQQAKKAITAIWHWFWRTAWRIVRSVLVFLWRNIREFFVWIFSRQQPQGRNP